jgi:hypothetical protein
MHLRKLIAAVLLASFTLDVTIAASPCAAGTSHRVSPAAAKSSCHSAAMARMAGMTRRDVSAASEKGGCCDPTRSDRTVCHRACHATAILRLPAALPALGRMTEAATQAAERSPSLFCVSIDHIPLA